MPDSPPQRPSKVIYLLLAALPITAGLVLVDKLRPRGQQDEGPPGAVASNDFRVEELAAPVKSATAQAEAADEMNAFWKKLSGLMNWIAAEEGVPFRVRQLLASFASQAEADAWAARLKAMGFEILGRIDLPGGGAVLKLGWKDDAALGKLAELTADGQAPPFDLGLNYLYVTPDPPEARSDNGLSGTTPSGRETLALMGADPQADWGAGIKIAVLDDGLVPMDIFGSGIPGLVDLLGADVVTSGAHGTAMASLITGELLGVIGIAPGSDVTMYRVLGADGVGDAFSVAQGIYAAVANGAQIINLSLGGTGDSPFLRQAVEYAQSAGVVLVAAVGNEGVMAVSYPAAYPGVIGVGAVDATNTLTSFSNVGPGVDITTQGLGILAASTKPGYASISSGSSPATALTSGAIAAVASAYNITPTQAAELLLAYANDNGAPGADEEYGAGSIDVNRTLNSGVKGIVDGAAVGGIVTSGTTTTAPYNVSVGVQNRGTENISQAVVRLSYNGSTSTAVVNGLAAGKTGVATFQWPKNRFNNAGTAQAILSVELLGKADSKPANNTQTITLVRP